MKEAPSSADGPAETDGRTQREFGTGDSLAELSPRPVHVDTLEVGWPLGKRDYLRVIDITSEIERETVEPTALVASGVPWPPAPCWPAPTAGSSGPARLLETSRGTVGRADATDVDAALSEADVVTEARTVLADTARRGSTSEEREAVARWLTEAVRRSTK